MTRDPGARDVSPAGRGARSAEELRWSRSRGAPATSLETRRDEAPPSPGFEAQARGAFTPQPPERPLVEVRGAPATSLETRRDEAPPSPGFEAQAPGRLHTSTSGAPAGRGARSASDEPRDPARRGTSVTGFRGSGAGAPSHLNHRSARWSRCEERQRRASRPGERRRPPSPGFETSRGGRGARSASDEPRDPATGTHLTGFRGSGAGAPHTSTTGALAGRGARSASDEPRDPASRAASVTGFRGSGAGAPAHLNQRGLARLRSPQRVSRWSPGARSSARDEGRGAAPPSSTRVMALRRVQQLVQRPVELGGTSP